MKKSLVFLLYDSRSGSTYLSALLNRYKGISVSLESRFVAHLIEYPGTVNRESIDAVIDYLQQEIQFTELGLDLHKLKKTLSEFGDALSRKIIIRVIIDQYFTNRDEGANCLILKHAPYEYLATVVNMFPEVRFLQIIRDGRAVFNSKKKNRSLDGTRMATNPLKAAWDWRLKLKKAQRFKDRTTNIFYEDLIRNQEETLEYILEELNIPKGDRIITKQQKDYFRQIGDKQKDLHKNVGKAPQTDVIDRWKQELSNTEISVYNYVNQAYLRKYNYTIERPVPRYAIIYYAGYLLEFAAKKIRNIALLLRKPSLLKLKLLRKYSLLKKNG